MTLAYSNDPGMPILQSLIQKNVLNPFHHLVAQTSRKKALTMAKSIQYSRQLQKLDSLQIQSGVGKALRDSLLQSELSSWSGHMSLVTTAISNFARKALIRTLPTNSNPHRWNRSKSSTCHNCGEQETENHILNNCSYAAVQRRYTGRHNAVLRLIISYILPNMSPADVLSDQRKQTYRTREMQIYHTRESHPSSTRISCLT